MADTDATGSEAPGVGHDAYAKEHTLYHTWRASKYYAAYEGIKEMLVIERHQHADDNRVQRIAALEFVVKLLEKLTDNELRQCYDELTTYLKQKGELSPYTATDILRETTPHE